MSPEGSLPLVLAFKISIIHPKHRILNVFRVNEYYIAEPFLKTIFFFLHYIYTPLSPLLKNKTLLSFQGTLSEPLHSFFIKTLETFMWLYNIASNTRTCIISCGYLHTVSKLTNYEKCQWKKILQSFIVTQHCGPLR